MIWRTSTTFILSFSSVNSLDINGPSTIFNDDFSNDSGMWSYFGKAYRYNANQSVVLTDLGGDEAGTILFSPEVTGSFTLNFSYFMGGGSGADGMAVMFYHDQSPYVIWRRNW